MTEGGRIPDEPLATLYWKNKHHLLQEKLDFIEEQLKDHCFCHDYDVKHDRLKDLCLFCRVLFKIQGES